MFNVLYIFHDLQCIAGVHLDGTVLSPYLLLLYIDGERQLLNPLDNDISNSFS
jgi:hypothetical protein